MSKICKNCGATLEDGALFCFECNHNPDEIWTDEKQEELERSIVKEKKKKLRIIAIIASVIVIVAIAVIILVNSITPPMRFISVKDAKKSDKWADSLTYLDNCYDYQYICVLTKEASGDIEIPDEHEKKDVVLVTAEPDACREITSITFGKNVKYAEHICDFEEDNAALTSVSCPNGHLSVVDCFNHCPALEETGLSFSGTDSVRNSFCECDALKTVDLMISEEATMRTLSVLSSFCGCDALEYAEFSGLHFLHDSFLDCPSLKAVGLYTEVKNIKNSFNGCSGIESVEYAAATDRIEDSFNKCEKLKMLSVPNSKEYIYKIINAFNECTSLQTLSFGRLVKVFTDSFNDCTALEDLTFEGVSEQYQNSFNRCPALTALTINTNKIKDSFNDCAGVTSLDTYATEFTGSFNDCSLLKSVALGYRLNTLTDSFENCAVTPDEVMSIKSTQQLDEERTQAEKEARKKDQERYWNIEKSYEKFAKVYDNALQKLADSGVIPPLSYDKYGRPVPSFVFDSSEGSTRSDQLEFIDKNAREKLTSEPDFSLKNVVLSDRDKVFWLDGDGKTYHYINSLEDFANEKKDIHLQDKSISDLYATNFDDCQYLIVYDSFASHVIPNYYVEITTNQDRTVIYDSRLLDRNDTTTLVFIIDAKKEEIISVSHIGTTVPGDKPISNTGNMLDDEAEEYILDLLKKSAS